MKCTVHATKNKLAAKKLKIMQHDTVISTGPRKAHDRRHDFDICLLSLALYNIYIYMHV
jgi:hypothetical protein